MTALLLTPWVALAGHFTEAKPCHFSSVSADPVHLSDHFPLELATPSILLKAVGQSQTRVIHDFSYLAFNTSRIDSVNAP